MSRKIVKKKLNKKPTTARRIRRPARYRHLTHARLPLAAHQNVPLTKPESRPVPHPRRAVTAQPLKSKSEPGSELQTVYVYIAGCEGLKMLAERLGEPGVIFKMGLSASGYIDRRCLEMGRDHYASCWHKGDDLITEPGFDRWELQQIVAVEAPESRVTCGTRHLSFKLPQGYSLESFDAELRRAFADVSLETVLRGKEAIADEARFKRLTCYQSGLQTELKMATELFCLKPRKEGDTIVKRIDALLIKLENRQRFMTRQVSGQSV